MCGTVFPDQVDTCLLIAVIRRSWLINIDVRGSFFKSSHRSFFLRFPRDSGNVLDGLSQEEIVQKVNEEKMRRERWNKMREKHRQNVERVRNKYNIPDKKVM